MAKKCTLKLGIGQKIVKKPLQCKALTSSNSAAGTVEVLLLFLTAGGAEDAIWEDRASISLLHHHFRPPVKVRLLPHRRARGLPPLGGLGVRAADGGRDSGLFPGGGGLDLARPAAVPADLLRQREDVPGADSHPAPLGK